MKFGALPIYVFAPMNTAPPRSPERQGPAFHQLLRHPAGELEEHEIGRRVVQEAREDAGQPEISGVVWRPVC